MSHLFAHLARMKLIQRWPLMYNVRTENVQEHSLQVAMVAHALAIISNRKFNGQYSPDRAATLAIFHDAGEILTGDLPTPVKYFNAEIEAEYKKIEAIAEARLLEMVPEEFRDDYRALFISDSAELSHRKLVKSADTLCAYLKCLEEKRAGNNEFNSARKRLETMLDANPDPAVAYFREHFIPSFTLDLDEINQLL
ncbi:MULTISPECIES: 5'-deoxynucleotidase [Shewanella]|uniref:5'-deoxynucleotidase n=1 Tax=Shewanella chilikensis TaxID=558541 RepID=A0ABX5PJ10_9GAMM|nr:MULTISPECIES: 5'-deoxynucleotidase [Shewanella]MCA0951182.1 5'-deoxynucleotidase [Shewanella chilikensis]MCL1153019.1 5'-deoxynucleotidase [Shewanella chilikensis]PYE55527.1 metal dependent phosphohydrolase [Shewanella chilikensis]GGZ42565.1 5'-deoxynucleotidase [Shewanella chilikensis]HCD15979.1 5'-deoxynucleotidase [Shewanella sp.]